MYTLPSNIRSTLVHFDCKMLALDTYQHPKGGGEGTLLSYIRRLGPFLVGGGGGLKILNLNTFWGVSEQ